MANLLQRLADAAREYGRRTGDEVTLPFNFMYWTGGSRRHRRIGAVDTSGMSNEEIDRLPHADVTGWFTLEQAVDQLEWLASNGVEEAFLVLAVVRAQQDSFRRLADPESYARGVSYRQQGIEHFERQGMEPEMLERMRAFAEGSPSELERHQEFARVWDELADPLIQEIRSMHL